VGKFRFWQITRDIRSSVAIDLAPNIGAIDDRRLESPTPREVGILDLTIEIRQTGKPALPWPGALGPRGRAALAVRHWGCGTTSCPARYVRAISPASITCGISIPPPAGTPQRERVSASLAESAAATHAYA
jgi:hypothetical protein